MKILKIFMIALAIITLGCYSAYTVDIDSWEDLANIGNTTYNPAFTYNADYVLTTNLDSSSAGYSTYAGPTANSNTGWMPIGQGAIFTGTFDGDYHTISDLTINRDAQYQALFRYTDVGGGGVTTISNLGLVNVDITNTGPLAYTAGLIAWSETTTIQNVFVTGTVENSGGGGNLGGIVARHYWGGFIENSYSAVDITGSGGVSYVGGIASYVYRYNPQITDTYAIGEINGAGSHTGGFAGYANGVFSENGWYDIVGDDATNAKGYPAGDVKYSNANDPANVNNKLAWIAGLDTLGLYYFPSQIDLLLLLSDGNSLEIDGLTWTYHDADPPGGPYDPGYAFETDTMYYIQLATSGGSAPKGGGAIPEPATVISFMIGGAGIAVKRFFKKE